MKPDLLKHIEANYNHYKHPDINNLVDFTDMIHDIVQQPNKVPNFDVVFIDEAQDLSLLQWEMIKALQPHAKDIYIAGDDDQCIYKWSGADINHFLGIEGTHRVLDKSYRLPKKIWALGQAITSTISNRFTKEWSPREEEGNAEW